MSSSAKVNLRFLSLSKDVFLNTSFNSLNLTLSNSCFFSLSILSFMVLSTKANN